MADSKYADLPGIAYNQVDVYETTDFIEAENFSTRTEDESEAVERLHINVFDAFGKFKGKQVSTKGIDFSDRISLKPRIGFGVWELPEECERESSIQKYQRLQCEIKELHEEVSQMKEGADRNEKDQNAVDIIAQVNEAGNQLSTLKIDNCFSTDLVAALSDPQNIRLRQLQSEIEQLKNVRPKLKSRNEDNQESETVMTGVLQYEMMFLPEKSNMQEFTRVAQLERRLARLESVLGADDDELIKFIPEMKSQGILESVRKLAAKAALLDSNQIDAMESRMVAILHRLDAVSYKKPETSVDSERDRKITDMYEISKKLEGVIHIVPQAVQRMIALNSIHRQAGEFSNSLTKLGELQFQISRNLQDNDLVLRGIQDSFAHNLERVHNNIKAFEERLNCFTGI